jgi:hypothetical protein
MKANKATRGEVEVLPPMTEEIALASEAGLTIKSFLSGVAVFFGKAAQLEAAATKALERAELLKPPTSAKEDEAIQTFIVERKDAAKVGTSHWETLTSTLHGWHKRSTARRGRTVDVELKAAEIAQRLHNGWAESEKRREAREAEEERQRAEKAAAAKRQKELDDLEAKAVAAEKKSPDLSPREASFVVLVVGGVAPYDAAKRSGYKAPAENGGRLMDTPKIQKAIKAARTAQAAREQAAAIAEAPLDVEVRDVKPAQVTKAVGATDRDTHRGKVVDEGAIIEAFRSGKYGIPGDLFQVNPTKLNEYARSLRENLNRWPGVIYNKNTSTF